MSLQETVANEQGQVWLETAPDSQGGYQLGSVNGLVGVLGATPIGQQTAAGETSGFTAGSGTASKSDSTFTGGVGSTAYTVGDLVAALKTYGWIKS